MILLGERLLRRALREYSTHYLRERNHQGVNNQLLEPPNEAAFSTGPIQRRDRLEGIRWTHRGVAHRVSAATGARAGLSIILGLTGCFYERYP